ncbi:ABC transporter ATP-binding protein [Halomonas sp. M20]|uniref:ABC transporter ATP-binding protein n=1 Tax=Halomonas sp. M20 TaxID=2763264 RepID=UPI001D09DAF8|nr:ABC transporter ATP-binding protein [Halomonas sp. M20]
MNIITFDGVTKRHGDVTSLNDLNLEVRQGEVLALLGHNGAGKTTAMKLILGLIAPSEGELRVFGATPQGNAANQLRQRLGFLPENVGFYEQLTGYEVLDYFARLKRVDRGQIDDLLGQVGLADASRRRVKTYSKGMRQRLGLAQTLLGEPQLLLLDEPTTGLDPAATRDFYTTVKTLRDRGCTVLLSSHVLPGVEPYIDRALILGAGRRLALGSLDELRHQAALPLTIRVKGNWTGAPSRDLPIQETQRLNGHAREFHVHPANKMTVLRELTTAPGVEDIELLPPSLEHLYTHFSATLSTILPARDPS